MVSLKQLFEWFTTGKFPSEAQFQEQFKSFWHKSERIDQSSVLGLPDALMNKADKSDLENIIGGLMPKGEVANIANLPSVPFDEVNAPDGVKTGYAYIVTNEKDENGSSYIFAAEVVTGINGIKSVVWTNTKLTAYPKDVALLSDVEQRAERVLPLNPFPYYNYVGGKNPVYKQTTANLGGIYWTDQVAKPNMYYTTRVAVTFSKITGLNFIAGYYATSKVVQINVADIVIGQEIILTYGGVVSAAGSANAILSQFRTDCNGSASVDVEYTIRYIKVFEGKYEASFFDSLENNDLSFVQTALISEKAKEADYATESDMSEKARTLTNLSINPVHPAQIDARLWTLSQYSTRDENGKIVMRSANPNRAQITIPNAVAVGEKYILLMNVFDFKALDNSQSWVLQPYNFSQGLFNINKNGLYYQVFTASASGAIQILVQPSSSSAQLPAQTEILSFNTDFCTIMPYSEDLENNIKAWKENYLPAPLYPIQTFNGVVVDNSITGSFDKIQPENDRVRQNINNELVANYQGGYISSVQYSDNKVTVSGTMPVGASTSSDFNYGFNVNPDLYATTPKTFVFVAKGTFTGENIKEMYVGTGASGASGNGNTLVMQDVEDNQPTTFKVMHEITYPAGATSNHRYVYFKTTPKDAALPRILKYEYDEWVCFEKIDGWNIDDYLNAVSNTAYIPKYLPVGTATEQYVNTEIEALKADILETNLTNGYVLPFDYDVPFIICYGQSLAVGGGATDGNSNFRNMLSFIGGCNEWASNVDINDAESVSSFYGTNLVLLNAVASKSHPPVAAAQIAWLSLLEKENQLMFGNFDYQFLMSTPGQSGAPITTFEKGTGTYNRLLFSVQKGKELAQKQGKTFGVPVIYWVQGEADRDTAFDTYYNKLKQLFIDLNTDIKAITGQTKDIQFIPYQMSPFTEYNGAVSACNSAYVHLKICQDVENVHMGGAMYQYQYGDAFHPSDRAIIGHQLGIQAKRVLNDEKPLPLFYPHSHEVLQLGGEWYLRLNYDVPVPPMRFDVSGDKWHNQNGKQPNFGFELLKNDVDIIASEPTIIRGSILQIKCSENPTGSTLRYAITGHYGGGNLCDSQNIIVNNKNTNYVIDNFAVAFRDYVI